MSEEEHTGPALSTGPAWALADLFRLDPLLAGKIEAQAETGCWLWIGACHHTGRGSENSGPYGRVKRRRVPWYIHRWVYRLLIGPIPAGHHIHHRVEAGCTNTLCCQPRHLEAIEGTAHEWLHRELASYEENGDGG